MMVPALPLDRSASTLSQKGPHYCVQAFPHSYPQRRVEAPVPRSQIGSCCNQHFHRRQITQLYCNVKSGSPEFISCPKTHPGGNKHFHRALVAGVNSLMNC